MKVTEFKTWTPWAEQFHNELISGSVNFFRKFYYDSYKVINDEIKKIIEEEE